MDQLDLFNSTPSQNDLFEQAFESLNPQQKKAVELIDGPVFVLAGPGTGKTQILALRIGYILKHTDTQAHNILCLTYTDAGTIAMRKRLVEFLGSTAYNIHIFTFHAFANQVIQENMYLFSNLKELQALSDLEKSEVFVELIDSIPNDHPLKRYKGAVYFEKRRLENLFQDMKKEAWTPEFISDRIDSYLEEVKNDSEFQYKRKTGQYNAGDVKPSKYNPIAEKMETLRAACGLYDKYEAILRERGRYDYDDMILWVLKELNQNEQLLRRYQEQYLYFLVDEYQDTNGVQNKLLDTLANYWEKPNLFAVGDDDQSIYRFQGANMDNITDFQKNYDPELIVLDSNYRSSQIILDASAAIIKNNDNRLSNLLSIDKNIIAKGKNKDFEKPVRINSYPNSSQEETAAFLEIEKMVREQQDLSKVAVIYRSHKDVADLIKVLEAKNIPINVRNRVNVLHEPFIAILVELLQFIESEYKESGFRDDLLFKTLVSPIFDISYADILKLGKLTAYDREKKTRKSWMSVLADKEEMKAGGIKEIEKLNKVYKTLSTWLLEAPGLTVQLFFEMVITESGILEKALLAPDSQWKIQLLNTFFDFIKEESVRNPKIKLKDLLDLLEKMEISDVSLPVQKIISAENGIHFITGHSAKGLEFEKVLIIKANADNWEKKRAPSNRYTYPSNLFLRGSGDKEEDERRVFFVAATRAEQELVISSSKAKDTGKEIDSTRFITEIQEGNAQIQFDHLKVENEDLLRYKAGVMEFVKLPEKDLINKELIDKSLENFELSVTALNKYLRCPVTFYYENIIRVPSARNSYAGFGSAVHYALEQFFNESRPSFKEGFASAKVLVELFIKGMNLFRSHFTDKEYERLVFYGEKILLGYHKDQLRSWFDAEDFKTEHKISNVIYRDVPIQGVIDRIEIHKDFVNVIDYKTGKPENASKKMKGPKEEGDIGGDYWRQLVYYKMLVDNDPKNNWKVRMGEVNMVEPDKNEKYKQFSLNITPKDMEIVGEQLVDSYQKILNHEFSLGCGEDDCYWCNFIRDGKLIKK